MNKYEKKTMPVENYMDILLADRAYITSKDIPLNNDSDYVMSIMIVTEYDNEASNYRLKLLEGNTSRNGYTIPNMRIEKR